MSLSAAHGLAIADNRWTDFSDLCLVAPADEANDRDWSPRLTTQVRSLFVSDLHLGCRFANADAFLRFLRSHQPDFLYLVGDILDGWKLRKSWYWNDTYSLIVKRLLEMNRRGTRILYAPGNHDDFLRRFLHASPDVAIADEFVHVAADRKRFLVMHGDRFDGIEQKAQWLSWIGDIGYSMALGVNHGVNRLRRKLGRRDWAISKWLKSRVKRFTAHVSDFENTITRYARGKGCGGVICGHIHTPTAQQRNGVDYFNTGDWIENCTALVEYADGRFELVRCP